MTSPRNPHPSSQDIKVAVDAVIFTVRDGGLSVLTIKMKKAPFAGKWALPGGLIGDDETTADAVRRVLKAETGVTEGYLEQLRAFDEPKRDPFGRVISTAYFALMPSAAVSLKTSEKYAAVQWTKFADIKSLAYDHNEILKVALDRVRERLGYSNIAWSLLPKEFRLADLQEVYEAILDEKMDKRNFRKKILASGLLTTTGKMQGGAAHRPAELFKFKAGKKSLAAA